MSGTLTSPTPVGFVGIDEMHLDLRHGLPSIRTVQAAQKPTPQPELGPAQTEHIAKNPQQRRRGVPVVDDKLRTVHGQSHENEYPDTGID